MLLKNSTGVSSVVATKVFGCGNRNFLSVYSMYFLLSRLFSCTVFYVSALLLTISSPPQEGARDFLAVHKSLGFGCEIEAESRTFDQVMEKN